MFVDTNTFDQMFCESKLADFGSVTCRVVSSRHLAALKIHAPKYEHPNRAAKDYFDLLALMKLPETKIDRAELQRLCLKYASEDLFQRLAKDLKL